MWKFKGNFWEVTQVGKIFPTREDEIDNLLRREESTGKAWMVM